MVDQNQPQETTPLDRVNHIDRDQFVCALGDQTAVLEAWAAALNADFPDSAFVDSIHRFMEGQPAKLLANMNELIHTVAKYRSSYDEREQVVKNLADTSAALSQKNDEIGAMLREKESLQKELHEQATLAANHQ